MLGLSDSKDFVEWSSVLVSLFDLNKNPDIRTQVVRAVRNIVQATELPEARVILNDFLGRMPTTREAYANANNYEFIDSLQAGLS